MVYCCGKCRAYIDGCRARYDLEIKEEDLLNLALGVNSHVQITMLVLGKQCTHVWKKHTDEHLADPEENELKKF